jgi:hypothetical protein
MHSLEKFQKYFLGGKFMVKTNHNNLRHFMGKKDLKERKQKWVRNLQDYEFDIAYFKGKKNVVSEAIFSRPERCLLT